MTHDLVVTHVPADTLIEHPRNVRRGNVDDIAASIRQHGQYRPLVVQSSTNHVIAGNHTLRAIRDVYGLAHPTAVTFVDVDDDTAVRMMLADNRTSDSATYDMGGLAELLAELADTNYGFDGTGYTDTDYADIIADVDIDMFGLDVEPVTADTQPDLTERAHVECPECGHTFDPTGRTATGIPNVTPRMIVPPDEPTITAIAHRIRDNLTIDLLKPEYRDGNTNRHPMWGHCYVASETMWHSIGASESGWHPTRIKHEGATHWWLQHDDGRIIDLTGDQFETPVPYTDGRRGPFLTKQPSARAQTLMARVVDPND